MAAFQNILNKTKLLGSRTSSLCVTKIQQNGMSQYPSYFERPVYTKELQNLLIKSGEIQKLAHIPIKAALIDQTSSQIHDAEVRLMTNYIMKEGNKNLARGLMDKTFENIKKIQLAKYNRCETEEEKAAIELNPKVIFHQAVENCKPIMNLTPIKRGGVKYQVPVPISAKRAQFLSMNWLIAAAKEKDSTVRFFYQLALELIDAANNTGRVVRKKQDLHRQCEANRAYAHYRWG